MAGHGYNPITKADMLLNDYSFYNISWTETRDNFYAKKQAMIEYCETLPSHRQFLLKEIYKETE